MMRLPLRPIYEKYFYKTKKCRFVTMSEKNLYIIAGCNGAGKTTASFTILPEIIDCKEFVNADEIAKGISPFQPEKVSFEAGRIMLNRINELIKNDETFAFETTLATRSHIHKVRNAKKKGYRIERQYIKGTKNLFDIFIPEVNGFLLIDNSLLEPKSIAKRSGNQELEVVDKAKFKQIKTYYEKHR